MIIFSHVSQCVVLCTLAVAESMPYDHKIPFPFLPGPTFSSLPVCLHSKNGNSMLEFFKLMDFRKEHCIHFKFSKFLIK